MARGPEYYKKKWRNNPKMLELIDALWPTSYALYKERKLTDLTINPEENPEYKYTPSKFGEGVSMAVALGHGHELYANLSIILGGFGSISRSYRETLLGAYPEDMEGTPDSWIETERLFAIGIGLGSDQRKDGFRMYKSGYSVFDNALRIGEFGWGANEPEAGALQYISEAGFEGYHNDTWNRLAFIDAAAADQKLTYYDAATESLKTIDADLASPPGTITDQTTNSDNGTEHTHEIDITIPSASPPETISSTTTNTDNGTSHTHALDTVTTAKSVTLASITVDAKGRVTSCANGTISINGYNLGSNNWASLSAASYIRWGLGSYSGSSASSFFRCRFMISSTSGVDFGIYDLWKTPIDTKTIIVVAATETFLTVSFEIVSYQWYFRLDFSTPQTGNASLIFERIYY